MRGGPGPRNRRKRHAKPAESAHRALLAGRILLVVLGVPGAARDLADTAGAVRVVPGVPGAALGMAAIPAGLPPGGSQDRAAHAEKAAPAEPARGGKWRPGRIVRVGTPARWRHNRGIMRKSPSASGVSARTILPGRQNQDPMEPADRPRAPTKTDPADRPVDHRSADPRLLRPFPSATPLRPSLYEKKERSRGLRGVADGKSVVEGEVSAAEDEAGAAAGNRYIESYVTFAGLARLFRRFRRIQAVRRSTRAGARARKARPRWEIAFFSRALICAVVRPAPPGASSAAGTKTGS